MPETLKKSVPAPGIVSNLRMVFAMVPWRMRPRVIFMCLATLVTAMLDLFAVAAMLPLTQLMTTTGELPSVIQRYIVPVVGTTDRQALLLIIAGLVASTFLFKNVLVIALRWWSIGENRRAASAVQARLLELYVQADYEQHQSRSRAAMLNVIARAVSASFDQVLGSLITLVVDLTTIVLLFVMLTVMSPLSAGVALVIFGGFALLTARLIKPLSLRYAHRGFVLEQEAFGYINPAIEGFRETRLFRRENLFTKRFRVNREEIAGLTRFQQLIQELPKYLLEVVMIIGILAIALILFSTQDETTAFGLLAVFAAGAMRIIPALNRVLAAISMMRTGTPSLAVVAQESRDLLAERAESARNNEQPVVFPPAAIVAQNVGFTYRSGTQPVLTGVDAVIEPGTTVALVGASGTGKSTFADILSGLLTPTQGAVLVDGINIAEHPNSWLSRVAVVSQSVYVWDASLRDLVTFGQPAEEVDEKLLSEAVSKARLDDLVGRFPDGLNTLIGDGGVRLSGGQTQRVGIARALYAQPAVLIMDEATSALDNETEYQITSTIESLRGEITVIVIAHRLSTVKNADQILFFSDGKLQDRGTMSHLYENNPEFARLVKLGTLEVDTA